MGRVGKVRPAVVMSHPQPDSQRRMCRVAPMTTEARGGECEVSYERPRWLKQEGVVNAVATAGIEHAKIIRRLGPVDEATFLAVQEVLIRILGFEATA